MDPEEGLVVGSGLGLEVSGAVEPPLRDALAIGVDSPTFRVLAGAPKAAADEEASEIGPAVFAKLGTAIHVRLTPAAVADAARLVAEDLLAGTRQLRDATSKLARMFKWSDDSDELAELYAYNELLIEMDDGVRQSHAEDVERAVREAAIKLVENGKRRQRPSAHP